MWDILWIFYVNVSRFYFILISVDGILRCFSASYQNACVWLLLHQWWQFQGGWLAIMCLKVLVLMGCICLVSLWWWCLGNCRDSKWIPWIAWYVMGMGWWGVECQYGPIPNNVCEWIQTTLPNHKQIGPMSKRVWCRWRIVNLCVC